MNPVSGPRVPWVMDDYKQLVAHLERARRRAAAAIPFSPEWDAATDEIEELEHQLAELRKAHQEMPLSA